MKNINVLFIVYLAPGPHPEPAWLRIALDSLNLFAAIYNDPRILKGHKCIRRRVGRRAHRTGARNGAASGSYGIRERRVPKYLKLPIHIMSKHVLTI